MCKILYILGKMLGKGSSLPGKIILRMFPDVLEQLKLPKTIIAVTGSNGKTTTAELIARALSANGMKVGWNYEGSNQTEGVATLLLRISSFSGNVKYDAIVMECDERYAKKIFEKVRPSALLVTNLCRDQLTRNGHPEFIEDCLRAAVDVVNDDIKLVLNADDPYVSALATRSVIDRNGVVWFGISSDSAVSPNKGMYDDGAFCPLCKERMTYAYHIAGHYGSYKCTSCYLKRNSPKVEGTVHENGYLEFNNGLKMKMALPSVTGAYNFCAAVAIAEVAGVSASDAVNVLNEYKLTGGRTVALNVGINRDGLLLVSKHENSFAYDRSLSWIVEQKRICSVIVVVDSISRKYYTSETSWLWDIDFGLLVDDDDDIINIVLAGTYANELAMRFAMTDIDQSKISYVADLKNLREHIKKNTMGKFYVLTCFADKAKVVKALEA